MALEPGLEHVLTQALAGRGAEGMGLEPGLAERLVRETLGAVEKMAGSGLPAVLLVGQPIRSVLSRFLRRVAPDLKVISHAEVPDGRSVRVTAMIGSGA